MNALLPSWQEDINWTVLVERQSYDTIVVGIVLLVCSMFLRRLISWYGRSFSFVSITPWEQLRRTGGALFSPSGVPPADERFHVM
jgi:hypothetical protein